MNSPESGKFHIVLFGSGSTDDHQFELKLRLHLSPLVLEGGVSYWTMDSTIGEKWKDKLLVEIPKADLILCLVSPDFWQCEERVQVAKSLIEGRRPVVPLLLRPTELFLFKEYSSLPGPSNADCIGSSDSDAIWSRVVAAIRAKAQARPSVTAVASSPLVLPRAPTPRPHADHRSRRTLLAWIGGGSGLAITTVILLYFLTSIDHSTSTVRDHRVSLLTGATRPRARQRSRRLCSLRRIFWVMSCAMRAGS